VLSHLTDEEAEELVLAAAVFGDLVGVPGQDVVDRGIDRAGELGVAALASRTLWTAVPSTPDLARKGACDGNMASSKRLSLIAQIRGKNPR
jgi:hypothetical protein